MPGFSFEPSEKRPDDKPTTWAPDFLEGVFAGYHIQPGYTWSKQYLVWPITDFDGLKLLTATLAAEFPLREPHKVGRIVVPPALWRFPLKVRYDFQNASLAGDREPRLRPWR